MVLDIGVFYHELEVAAKITAIVFCLVFAAYFWNRSRGADLKSAHIMFLGQGLFVFCFGMTRIFFLIADYFRIEPEFASIVLEPNEFLNLLFWKISSLIGILAIMFLLFVIETYLVKSKYIFTLIALAGLIVALILPDINQARLATYIAMPIALIGVIALYTYLFFKGSGEIRKKAGLSLDGFIIFGVGVILDTNIGKNLFATWFHLDPIWQLGWLPMVLMIVGLALYTYYNIKE